MARERQDAAGPGRFAERTDRQAVAAPKQAGNLDRQYGDTKEAIEGQKIAPIREGQGPLPDLGQLRGPLKGSGGLPGALFSQPTTRPDEPFTQGLDLGAGAGPEVLNSPGTGVDKRELVLEYLANNYDNQDAIALLRGIRQERMAQQPAAVALAAPPEGELDASLDGEGELADADADASTFEGEPLEPGDDEMLGDELPETEGDVEETSEGDVDAEAPIEEEAPLDEPV